MATLKQLMTILSIQKVSDEDRAQLVCSWTNGRTTSARELRPAELQEIVNQLQNTEQTSPGIWRKRVMAAIYGFLKKMNKEANSELVKGIACRAAKIDDFNKIPVQRLVSLYTAFTNMQKDLNFAKKMVESFTLESQNYN
jgi:hypothetical protein